MAQFLDEAAITGVAPAGASSAVAPKGARFLDESAITGRPPEPPTFLENLAGFLGEKAGEVGAAAKSVGEFVGAGIGMGVGAVAGSAKAVEELAKGKGRREALQSGIETSGRVGAALNPMTVATKLLGYQPDPTVLDNVMEKISQGIHHYGEKVEVGTKGVLLAEDVDLFAQLLMGAGMGKATVKGIGAGVKKATAEPARGTSMADMVPREEAAAEPTPPMEATPETLKSAFEAAKANRVGEVSDTAAVDSIFARAKAKGLAQVGPAAPEGAGAVPKSRMAEGLTLEEARAKVEAEKAGPTDADLGFEKVRAGRGFDVTAEERIAMNRALRSEGHIVDAEGRLFSAPDLRPDSQLSSLLGGSEKVGALFDKLEISRPDLFKSVLLAGGVAAFAASNPDNLEDLAYLSGAVLGIKQGKEMTPSHIFERVHPEFKDSTLRSEKGDFITLFHGGKALAEGMPTKGYGLYGEGLYTTGAPKRASGYTGKDGAVYPIYANLKNPISSELFMDRFGRGIRSKAEAAKITETLKAEGYDGIVDRRGDSVWEAVIFDPKKNVKSALSGVSPKEGTLAKDALLGERMGEALSQRGAADPKLLAGIAALGGMAAYIVQNPEKLDTIAGVAGVGALGAARGKLKGLPESAVIDAARKGDQAAFTQLYLDNAKMIERSLHKYERTGADVEDVLQRTWEKAFNALKRDPDAPGGFKGDSKFSTFVFKIAQNEANRKVVHERARPTTELTPEMEETLGHEGTPQREVGNRQLSAQLETALDKLDPTFREAFVLRELDGLPYEDIAAQLDVPIGTVRSRISRAKDQLQRGLREHAADFGQRGGATPEQLIGLASIAGGAAVGGLLDPENSVRNAIYGALAGGALGTGAGRGALKAVIRSPDAAMGLISTRLGNIAPELKFKLRAHELRVLQQTEAMNDAVLPFIQALAKLPKDTQQRAARALLNGDTATVEVLPGLGATFPAVQKALRSIEGQLKVLGRFGEGVSNYFPRIVKDFEGLKAALGQEARVGLEKRLIEAEAKMIRKEGRSLTDIEESLIVNRYLFSPDETSFQPGFAKARRIQDVPESLQKFYEPPTESLLRYLSGAVNDIETARFFGRDLTTKSSGKKVYTDVDSSIGNLTARLMGEGRLTQAQAMELRDMLKARFEGGEKGMHTALANVRNITNLGLLGNIASAATQIGDSLMTVYHHGLTPTLQAVTEKLIGKERVTPKQLGLINHVAEELSEMGASGRALHIAMKYSGFKAIDMYAKGLGLNAALIKNQRLVSTPEGAAQFRAKYQAAFGDSVDGVIADLRAGRRSPEVDQLAFSELSDTQPVSKAEMPEMYLAHPNGRLLYQLKTYMLKQTDIVRRDAYQEIAKGTPEGIMRGTKNLAALATVYALANVPGDVVKDLLSGREVDPFNTPRLVENVFQTFGVNRYAGQQLGQGKVVETALGLATPPVRVLQDIAKLDEKSVGYVPLVGRPVADRYFGGNTRREIYETRLANKGLPKGTGKPLSPEAKEYLRQKRLKAKEKQYAR